MCYYILVKTKRNIPADEKSKYVRMEREKLEEISNFLFQLGNQFVNIKNANGAFDCFKYSIDLNDKNQPSVYNLGALYNITGNTDGAYRMFREAVRMKPEDMVAKIAMAEVGRKLGNVDESKELLRSVQKIDPDNYMVLSAIAMLEYDMGNLAEALKFNDMALAQKPGDIHMILNRALIGMTYGMWPENWGQYEWCLSYQKNEKMRGLTMSGAWAGQECEGKTIIVVSDQGSGDAIQFSRYLAEVKRKGKFGKLIYLVQPDLTSLLSRVDGVDEVVEFGEKLKIDYDVYSSLLGIMRVLQVSPQNCWRPPHIKTDPRLDQVWEHRVMERWTAGSKRIGIVWAGDPRHGNDHARSIPLRQFLKFFFGHEEFSSVPNTQFFSFQVGSGLKQLHDSPVDTSIDVVDLGIDFRNFDDTASALRQMDLLITCDTSVAHLAGCQGIPCWVLVPNPPEWRWMTDVSSSPWYRTTRVYRQREPRNWDSVFNALLRDLHDLTREKAA